MVVHRNRIMGDRGGTATKIESSLFANQTTSSMILEVAKYIMNEFKSGFLFFSFVFLGPNPLFYETCKDFFLAKLPCLEPSVIL